MLKSEYFQKQENIVVCPILLSPLDPNLSKHDIQVSDI